MHRRIADLTFGHHAWLGLNDGHRKYERSGTALFVVREAWQPSWSNGNFGGCELSRLSPRWHRAFVASAIMEQPRYKSCTEVGVDASSLWAACLFCVCVKLSTVVNVCQPHCVNRLHAVHLRLRALEEKAAQQHAVALAARHLFRRHGAVLSIQRWWLAAKTVRCVGTELCM